MRVAVMGAGSIGGYFGGMLARTGNDVTLIARGGHLQSILSDGLKVIRDEEEFVVRCQATDDPAQAGTPDLALLTVKTYHNSQAIPSMKPMIGPDTTVLCLQNGIDSYRSAADHLGKERVMPGAAYIEAGHPSPGVVTQTGAVVRIVFGEPDGGSSDRGERIRDALEDAGLPAELSTDIQKTLWSKFLFIATMAGVTSLSRRTMAELMPVPEWRGVIEACMKEIEAVGRAAGVGLEPDIVGSTLDYILGSLEQMHASMHADVMAGRPLELDALNGAVVRAGRSVNVPTPINDVINAMLKPLIHGVS